MGILDYSATPASNTTINGIGISGASSVKYGDDAIRQFMADVRSAVTKSTDKAAGTHMATKADHNQLWRVTGNATINLTAAATLTAGWALWVLADGGTATIDPAGSEQINGATTLALSPGNAALIICTATAFRAFTMVGPGFLGNSATLNVGTTAGTVAAGDDNRIVSALRYQRALGSGEDLNIITEPGVYSQNTNAGAAGGTNYPVPTAGLLEVVDGVVSNVKTVQRYTVYATGRLHQRIGMTSGVWSPWINVTPSAATTSDEGLMSAADKVKLNGIAAGAQVNLPVGTGSGTVAAGNDSRIVNAVQEGDSRLTNSREWTAATVSQAEAEAGTATTRRAWTAQRVAQAIAANAVTPDYGAGNAALAVGAIGTYALMQKVSPGTVAPGTTIAGSDLKYTDIDSSTAASPAPTGTWQCMGRIGGASRVTVFLRIA